MCSILATLISILSGIILYVAQSVVVLPVAPIADPTHEQTNEVDESTGFSYWKDAEIASNTPKSFRF